MFQGISVDETVVIVMLRISLGENIEGAMNICLPGTLLFNIFDIIEKTKHLADKDNSHMQRDNREEILESIKESEMGSHGAAWRCAAESGRYLHLHVGDVIDLNKPQDSAVSVHVAGQPWFKGKLGVYNKNIAVKIEERAEEKKCKGRKENDGEISKILCTYKKKYL